MEGPAAASDASGGAPRARRGHRALPHTADVMIEAWGSSRAACLEESVAALAELYLDVRDGVPSDAVPVSLSAASDDDLLVVLLERAAAEADLGGGVVVAAELRDLDGIGVAGRLITVPVEAVEVWGAVPKGVSRSGLGLRRAGTGWRCRAVIDV